MKCVKTLEDRVELLEKQNRWMKRAGCAVLVLFASVLAMGQAKPVPKVVEAQKFILRDSQGRMVAELTSAALAGGEYVGLDFIDPSNGLVRSRFTGGGVLINDLDSESGGSTELGMGWLSLQNKKEGEAASRLTTNSLTFGPSYVSTVMSSVTNPGVHIGIEDSDGFSAVLGKTDLVTTRTGEKHTTSAASLTLFGKENKVIWSAP